MKIDKEFKTKCRVCGSIVSRIFHPVNESAFDIAMTLLLRNPEQLDCPTCGHHTVHDLVSYQTDRTDKY